MWNRLSVLYEVSQVIEIRTDQRRGRIFVAVLAFTLFLSYRQPHLNAGEGIQTVDLREVLSIGDLEDDVLYMWAGVVSDEEGNIYVTDAMDYSLKKFDVLGQYVGKCGRRGQGPGEFLAPRLLSSSGRFMYATDQSLPGIQVFSQELRFQYRIPFPWAISCMKVLTDDRIAIVPVSVNENGYIYFIDRRGDILEEVKYCDDNQEMLMNLVEVEVDLEGSIYLAYCFKDRIEKMSSEGEKLWSCVLLDGRKIERKKIKTFMVPTRITYKSIAMDNSQRLYVLGGSLSKNESRDVYILNTEGQHFATLTLPEPSHCIYLDREDYLYSRANEGTTLKKYEVKFETENHASSMQRESR